jgi:hypothetical protein
MDNCDGHVMPNDDANKEERYREKQHYSQNSCSNDELESVKCRLETIFPMRNWSNTEIAALRKQMPIPEWELTLITRFYSVPGPQNPFAFGKDLLPHHFFLARRRQTMKTLLEHWGEEVTRGRSFFGDASRRVPCSPTDIESAEGT